MYYDFWLEAFEYLAKFLKIIDVTLYTLHLTFEPSKLV